VNSFAIVHEGEIFPKKLEKWMHKLSMLPPERGTIYRIKAILAIQGERHKRVFHAVMDISDEEEAGKWEEGEKKISKIVFIGKALDEPFLRQGFMALYDP